MGLWASRNISTLKSNPEYRATISITRRIRGTQLPDSVRELAEEPEEALRVYEQIGDRSKCSRTLSVN